ncbi:MAG: hypothetical protein H6865_05150 [Rhodospirillales bacterium]|nr:hypothetical protein [Rhodospirillales bacterium]USO08222.1 MAG: hypothetical protein H6866_03140 [Rhodospirillales bacterium]
MAEAAEKPKGEAPDLRYQFTLAAIGPYVVIRLRDPDRRAQIYHYDKDKSKEGRLSLLLGYAAALSVVWKASAYVAVRYPWQMGLPASLAVSVFIAMVSPLPGRVVLRNRFSEVAKSKNFNDFAGITFPISAQTHAAMLADLQAKKFRFYSSGLYNCAHFFTGLMRRHGLPAPTGIIQTPGSTRRWIRAQRALRRSEASVPALTVPTP